MQGNLFILLFLIFSLFTQIAESKVHRKNSNSNRKRRNGILIFPDQNEKLSAICNHLCQSQVDCKVSKDKKGERFCFNCCKNYEGDPKLCSFDPLKYLAGHNCTPPTLSKELEEKLDYETKFHVLSD